MTLQIVVPMAGRGSRFSDAGYRLPKPLIDVGSRPMIEVVVANLRPAAAHRFVFVVQTEHLDRHQLGDVLAGVAPGCDIFPLDAVTEGAACTVLTTRGLLDPDEPLMIANCDQWVSASIDRYLADGALRSGDGSIMTMQSTDPKWSFVNLDSGGWVTQVAEKRPISTHATVGIYNFARAGDFLESADRMIRADDRVNGEFYVAPVYNELVACGARIGTWDLDEHGESMHGLGVPEDLRRFLDGPHLARAAAA